MFGMVVVALLSVIVPLSLCAVPAFARYTVFPLLSRLIYKFTSAYLLPGVEVEYALGSFTVKDNGWGVQEVLRGISLMLKHVQLRPEFLKSLAFERKGIAPLVLRSCRVQQITARIASSWRVVVEIQGVSVNGIICDPNGDVVEMKDAAEQKIGEVAFYLNRLLQEKQRVEYMRSHEAEPSKQFSFKDRVLQLIMAQLDVEIRDVDIQVDGCEQHRVGDVNSSVGTTALHLKAQRVELVTVVKEDNREKALERVLYAPDVRVEQQLRFTKLALNVFELGDSSVTDEVHEREHELIALGSFELALHMPPILRLIAFVENLAPIPVEQKLCRVQLLSSSSDRIVLSKEMLGAIIRDFYVPYLDYGVVIRGARMIEDEEATRRQISGDDVSFYLEHYGKVDTNKSLSAQHKEEINNKLLKLEIELSMEKIINLRSRALGLGQFFREKDELTRHDALEAFQEVCSMPENVLYSGLECAVRFETVGLHFAEEQKEVSSFVINELGLNYSAITLVTQENSDRPEKSVDMIVGETVFSVENGALNASQGSGTKILYPRLANNSTSSDALSKPNALVLQFSQRRSGQLLLKSSLAYQTLVLSPEHMEAFLLFIDRFSTELTQEMALSRPPEEVPCTDENQSTPHEQDIEVRPLTPFALLGGKILEVDLIIQDTHLILKPVASFSSNFYSDVDFHMQGNNMGSNSRIDIPIDLCVQLKADEKVEQLDLQLKKVAIIARYLEAGVHDDDAEDFLAPTQVKCSYSLSVDERQVDKCNKTIDVMIPDIVFACSDLGLALFVASLQGLTGIRYTTPEQELLKQETLRKQQEKAHQAEVDAMVDRIRRLYNSIDRNHDNAIDRQELRLLLRNVGIGDNLLERELSEYVDVLFNSIDEDKSGGVDFNELAHFLRSDLNCSNPGAGGPSSRSLDGPLNLRAGEYTSMEELGRVCNTRVRTMDEFEACLKDDQLQHRFWSLVEREIRIEKGDLKGQSPLTAQKKLTRLLRNYRAASLCWDYLIKDTLMNRGDAAFVLQAHFFCGGLSEYETAASVIVEKKKSEIFGALLEEVCDVKRKEIDSHRAPAHKELVVATNIRIGSLKLELTDAELPAAFCRGDFILQELKCAVDLQGKAIDPTKAVNWMELANSSNSEWSILCGLSIAATCYSDLAHAMEGIIEPWELLVGLSSNFGENGCAALVEANKRMQINITPSLLKMYKVLADVLDGSAQPTSLQYHREAFESALATRMHNEKGVIIVNQTGCALDLQLEGDDIAVKVDNSQRVFHPLKPNVNNIVLQSLRIADWGELAKAVALPPFGYVNVPIVQASRTILLTVKAQLDDKSRQRITIKSSLYLCNHTSQTQEVKYCPRGLETSRELKLRNSERMTLSLDLFMNVTEIYGRIEGYDDWVTRASLDYDELTSSEAMDDLKLYEEKQAKEFQERQEGKSIMYGENDDTRSILVKRLASNLLLRRMHLRDHIRWEISILPPFAIRNSLPYTVEYRFIEYTASFRSMKNPMTEIERLLHAESTNNSPSILGGIVDSGSDAEVCGISCTTPGYLALRLLQPSCDWRSGWSKALLMDVNGNVERFTTSQEAVVLDEGLQVDLNRLTLPGFPRLVRLSSPYWLINSSSFNLEYAATAEKAKKNSIVALKKPQDFTHPFLAHLNHGRISIKPASLVNERPAAWELLGRIPESAYSSSSVTEDALQHSEWSDAVNANAINTVGECVCGRSVIAMKVEGLLGVFDGSVALTFSPRFILQNRLNEAISLVAFGSAETNSEDVTKMFRKMDISDVKRLQMRVSSGETMPLYNFAPLKREPLEKCQKYISVSFGERWSDGKSWSFAIPINTAGDLYFEIFSVTSKRSYVIQASVQVQEMYVYIILSDMSVAPPFRIENYTPFVIESWQLGDSSSLFSATDKAVHTTTCGGVWHSFAWHHPLAKEKKMEFRILYEEGKTPAKTYDVDGVGDHESITLDYTDQNGAIWKRVEVVVRVAVDENTRVIKFVDHKVEKNLLELQRLQNEEFGTRKMNFASAIDVRLAGFGLSLFDALPKEVLFASIDNIQLQKKPSTLEWTFSIFHCQLDNMLSSAKYPAILNPVDAGFSSPDDPVPLFRMVLAAEITTRVGVYKLMETQLSPLALKVDFDFLVSLAKLLDPYFASDAMVQAASARMLDKVVNRRVPPVPITQLRADGNISHDLVYFDVFRIHAATVELEYSITRKDIVSSAGGGHSVIFGLLTQIIGVVGSNLGGSPTFSFNEIVILRCFSTKQRLQSQLIQNYIRQAVLQAYRLIASVDIIGNPMGLVEDLGSGVIEFLKITKDEVLGDSQTRGEGVKVLGKTVVRAGASTLAKVTGGLDKFVGEMGSTGRDAPPSNKSHTEPKPATGIAPLDGGIKFAKDFGKGLTGIFTKPVEGAKKGGVTGLLQGTVQGITGPGVVILKQITSTTHTIAMGVQSTVVDRTPFGGRRRQSKRVENRRIMADYDPNHYHATRMFVEVIGASGLIAGSGCDACCVVRVDSRNILQTRVLYNSANPQWKEKTEIELDGSEREVQFVVKDSYGGAINKTLGKAILSMDELQRDFKPPEYSSALAKWVKTGVKPDDTRSNTDNDVKEKLYTLIEPTKNKSSAIPLIGRHSRELDENDYQVLVTIVAVRDFRTAGHGGGVLGLGNLVSSTPNISPYVAATLANHTNRTKVAKMQFHAGSSTRQLLGNASWNETFTFSWRKRSQAEGDRPVVSISVKDKSMLHDETMAYGYIEADLSKLDQVQSKTIALADSPGSQTAIGHLELKLEVIAAVASSAERTSASSTTDAASVESPRPHGSKVGKVCVRCKFT